MITASPATAATNADQPINLETACVTGQADKWFFLGGLANAERALRADSCLLAPECGDTVLVCTGVSVGLTSVPYILAVLSRAHSANGMLILPGGATISGADGKLSFAAKEVLLEASQAVSINAPRVSLAATDGELKFIRLRSMVQDFYGAFGQVQSVAQSINSTVGRLLQKATNSFRWTENVDETRAGRMRLQVEERYHLKARHASVIAEGQVKIDAEKIDLG